jgi:hypothetical protein
MFICFIKGGIMRKLFYCLSLLVTFLFVTFLNTNAFAAANKVEQEYNFTNFSGVETSADWDVKINYDSKYKIKIITTQEELSNLLIEKSGKTLSLSTRCQSNCPKNHAEISMPVLNKLETSGFADVAIKGFNSLDQVEIETSGRSGITLDNSIIAGLSIDCSGDISFEGRGNQIEDLILKTSGSSDIDLIESQVTNADVDLSGSSKVKIKMVGGDMTGETSGSSSIFYKGVVKNQNIKISGQGSIKQKDYNAPQKLDP